MSYTDTHCHLFLPEFDDDRDSMIQRALKAGVDRLFLPHVDSGSTDDLLALADAYPAYCFPLMGLHPTSVEEDYLSELDKVESWLSRRTFYGIGEIGIDLYWDQSTLKEQTDAFITQLKWADQSKLPVVIHVRNSFKETIEAINASGIAGLTGIFHCFTGTYEEAQQVINIGFHLGIGGVLTFKNAGLDEVISQIDPSHLVLETDSPYLAPVPKRGKRNEPAYLAYTAQRLSEVLGIQKEDLAEITTNNSKKIFRI